MGLSLIHVTVTQWHSASIRLSQMLTQLQIFSLQKYKSNYMKCKDIWWSHRLEGGGRDVPTLQLSVWPAAPAWHYWLTKGIQWPDVNIFYCNFQQSLQHNGTPHTIIHRLTGLPTEMSAAVQLFSFSVEHQITLVGDSGNTAHVKEILHLIDSIRQKNFNYFVNHLIFRWSE